jgi:hypothetical protein
MSAEVGTWILHIYIISIHYLSQFRRYHIAAINNSATYTVYLPISGLPYRVKSF